MSADAVLIDTCALVFHFVHAAAPRVRDAMAGTELALITTLSVVEFRSVLAKLARSDGPFAAEDYADVNKAFSYACQARDGGLRVRRIRKSFVDRASRLIEEHGLRGRRSLETLDCLHLMTALDLQSREYPGLVWLTGDSALARIAEDAGIRVEFVDAPVKEGGR